MPRLRPVKTKEEAAAIPLDQTIEIDVTDAEVKADGTPVAREALNGQEEAEDRRGQQKADSGEKRQVQEKEEVDDDPSAALTLQLETLKRAEETARRQVAEQTLRAETAERRVRDESDKTVRYRADAEQAQYDAILNAIGASQAEIDAAKKDVKSAGELQDWDKLADAQERLGRSGGNLSRLEEGKIAFEARAEERKVQRETPAPQQRQASSLGEALEAAIAPLPEPAKAWMRSHPEYMYDQRKNVKIQALHWDIIDEGHQQFSQSYFDSLEEHLGLRTKEQPERHETNNNHQRTRIVSAPPTRDVPSSTTGRPQNRVTLTAAEREAAKFSGVDEVTYARNKMKLQKLKGEGYYNDR